MDKIEAIKVFVRVAELESFTRAAEALDLTKASVSIAVQSLEGSLGARLLQRTTRKVQLTQDGKNFYERALDLLADFEETETMFRNDRAELTGRIRVDMPVRFARTTIIPALPKFIEMYPGLEVELSCTDRRVDLIREGFDCVIRVGNLTDSGLIAKNIGSLTLANCVSPSYIEKYGRPKKLEDLKNHFLVHYVQSFGCKDEGFEYFDGEKYRTQKMKSLITVNNTEAYSSACVSGLGIVQAPRSGLQQQLDDGTLIEILPKLKAEPMPVSILYPHRRHLPKRVRVFMDWTESVLRGYVK